MFYGFNLTNYYQVIAGFRTKYPISQKVDINIIKLSQMTFAKQFFFCQFVLITWNTKRTETLHTKFDQIIKFISFKICLPVKLTDYFIFNI